MADVAEEATEALEAASEPEDAETEDSSPEEVSAEPEGSEKPRKSSGAQARIRELVEQTKELKAELDTQKNLVSERDEELKKLVDLAQTRENDSRVVKRIQELYETKPELKDMLEQLDKHVRGIEDVEEKESQADSKEEKAALKKHKETLEATKQHLEDQIADQRADLLLHKAELILGQYMDQLKSTGDYSEDDVKVIQRVMQVDDSIIDWDAIEENPDKMGEVLSSGFQKALDWYGKPRGSVKATEEGKPPTPEQKTQSAKEKLDKILSQDYGKMKAVKTPAGKEVSVPEMSQEDFVAKMAEALRLEKQLP